MVSEIYSAMRLAWALVPASLLGTLAFAGPPFLTDDPDPVPYRHWEAYVFAIGDRTDDGDAVEGPAAELNYGIAPNTQLHLIVPFSQVSPSGEPRESGLGDTEFGVKYRFVSETDDRPEVGVFPLVELPTGNSARGLGNGRAWVLLPLWLQKSWGHWTTYGGGGAALNSAPGQRNYPYGGWLLQRDLGTHLTLGGEIFSQGADTTEDRGFTAFNLGGSVNLNDNLSILFSSGRSFAGQRHQLWYLALYSTWGPKEPLH